MKVKLHPWRSGLCYGNILWTPSAPMRAGKFPANHPVGGGFCDHENGQSGSSVSMQQFRELGYWASCFPEGDGITWKPLNGQSLEQTKKDIETIWPWEVQVAK